MSTKGRENWEKYKAGYVSTRLAEEVSTGNAGRDSWNKLKKTIRFDKPESTQDVVSGSGEKKGNRVVGSPGGTALGGFSYTGKKRREKTVQELEAEKEAQVQAYEEYVRLATMDLDAQEKAIAEAKEKAAQSKPKYNIHAFGAYDTTQTDEEKNYSKLLADLNKAKSIQYDIKGRKELDALSEEQTDALGRLSEASRPQTSVMATNQANEDAAQKAKGELTASGLSDEKIRELLGYYKNIPKREKNAELYEDIQGAAEAYAETNPGLATVTSVGTNIVSGIGAIGTAINRTLDPNTPVDYHGGEFLPYAYTSGVRDTVSRNLEKDYGKGASFAYGVGTSMLDSAATVGLTMAGVPAWLATSTLGGAAATAAMQEAKDRGLDDNRAIWTGLLAGAAETAFEKISLESLISMKAPTGTMRQRILGTIKNTAKQAGVEGSEEVFTDFANLIADGIVNGDLSQVQQTMSRYIDDGMTEQEARNKAVGEWLKDTAVDFAAGALAGGIMGGGANALSRASQKAEIKREYTGREQELIDKSKELLPDNQEAEKLRSKMQNKLGSKRGLTGGDIEKLLQSNVDAPFVRDVDKITEAVKNQLELYGESGNTDIIAAAVTKRLLRENESGKETEAFVNSKYGRRVLNELNPENFDGDNRTEDDKPRALFNSEWTGKIGTKVFAPEVFSRDVGVTGAKYNAETGKLDAIVKDKAGKIETVPAEQAELSPLQEELFDWAADLGEAGPVLVSAYRQEQNMETYARQFHNAYEYGKAGVPMDYVNKSQAVSHLNTTQREIAYEEGAKAHKRELQGRQEKKRSGGTVDSTTQKKPTVSLRGATVGGVKYAAVNKKAMDGRQWASVGTMKAFAQATGVNVVFYESQANERGEYEGANGFYKDGTLYLDINAGRDRVAMGETAILKTAAHEITHYIKEGSPEQYEVLKNFVVEKLTREKGISFDDLVTDKQRREPGLSYEEAVDEVVADACEMMLKDSKAVEQLARENRSLAERIRQWIRKWVRSLKAAMEGLTADRPESRAMMQYAQELQEIWDNALVDAARNVRGAVQENAPAEVKRQVRENFSNEIDGWAKDDMPEGVRFTLGSTGPVLQGLGAIESDIYMEGDKIKKIMQDHPEMTLAEIKKVPQILEDPALILKSEGRGKSGANSRLVCFGLTKAQNGQPVMTVMDLRPRENGFVVDDMQKVNSAYTKNNPMAFIQKSDVVYADKKRAIPLLRTTGLTISSQRLLRNGYIGSISYKGSSVNIEGVPFSSVVKMEANDKVQNSMRDSAGRELTEAQQEYFKDSKVRDADGQLKPVYHGSAAIFTKFSADFMSQNGSSEGQGFYFTDYKPMAQGYEKNGGQLLEGYLDIKKPLSDSEVTLTAAEVKQLIKAVDPTGDDLVLNYDSRGGLGYPSRAWYNRSVEDTLRATMSTSESDSEILAELANGMGDPGKVLKTVRELLGYDGYIVEGKYNDATVYVAFDSSQFKNADNKTPTADPDIRFQQREPRLSDRAVLEWAAEMALRDKSKSWTAEDREQLERFRNRMRMLQDTQAELEALKEERKVLLAGRKVSEITGEERTEVTKNKNRIDIAKGKAERYEAAVWELESKAAIKKLLKKSRSIVEADASDTARRRYREQRYEGQRKAVERRKVERVAKKLITDLNTNNDKKHIPEPLKRPIGELLESLDFISGDARANKKIHRRDLEYGATLRRLKDALDTYRKNEENGTGEGIDGYIDLPPDLSELISKTAKKFEDNVAQFKPGTNVIASMNLEDLLNLYKILSSVREGIVNIDKMYQNEQFERVKFIGERTIRDLTGKKGDAGTIKKMAMWDNTLPWYAFQRFGEGGRSIFEELMNGQDKFAYNANYILEFRKKLIADKTVRAWDKEIHELELTTHEEKRVKVTMTTTQLMNLYLLSRRKHGLNHILGGGIRLKRTVEPTLVNTVREKVSKDEKKLNQEKTSEHFKLKDAEVGQMIKLLTPEQIKVANALQKFAAEVGGAWGNEITMRRFGFRGFTEENYWTIEVDKQDLSVEPGDKKDGSLYRLQNISAVKPLTEEAKGAVVIRGVFDVFSDHMTDMAKYNAFVLPIIDAQRWLNYKTAHENNEGHVNNRSVQRTMTMVYGEAANNYVIEFLRDLNGVKESGDRGDTLTKRMISKAKRVKVALNFNVAAQQPTSYMRASAVLEHKYLAKAFAAQERDTAKDRLILEQDRKELLQYSGIALWKEMGFFDTDIGHSLREQIKGGQSLSDKIVDKTMLGAEWGDKLTWARLLRACKLEVQDKQHLSGEAMLKAAAKRFREVIYRTQVVDSTLTRSHNMRSNSTFAKFSTAFMSEPTVSYNVAMYATENMVRETAEMGLKVAMKRNWRQVIRQYQAVLASGVAAALVSAIDAALRDPDDDPFFEKVWKKFFGEKSDSKLENAANIILGLDGTMLGEINPLSKLPELKGMVNALSGFGSGRMDMDVITNAQRAVQIWDEYIRLQTGDLEEPTKTTYYGNMTPYGRIYPTLKALSDFSGLPISNLSREVTTLFNTGCWAFGVEENKVRTYQSKQLREAWENYGKDSGVSYAVMYRATQDTKDFKSDKDKDGNTISGSLKAKYVDYIKGLGLNRAQGKAVWEAAKNPLWSDKGTPWG